MTVQEPEMHYRLATLRFSRRASWSSRLVSSRLSNVDNGTRKIIRDVQAMFVGHSINVFDRNAEVQVRCLKDCQATWALGTWQEDRQQAVNGTGSERKC